MNEDYLENGTDYMLQRKMSVKVTEDYPCSFLSKLKITQAEKPQVLKKQGIKQIGRQREKTMETKNQLESTLEVPG